jgi:chromosome partitioning protein
MKTLVFANQKGGAGKTTIAGHMAVQAELEGLGPVALIDTDPQGSLAEWWNARSSPTLLFPGVELADLKGKLEELRKSGVNLVVIDTPPAVTDTIRKVIEVVDLVIIPVRPSPHDLRAVQSTVAIVESVQKPMIFVLNGAAQRAKITADAAINLSQHGKVAPVTVYQRTDFAQSMIDGRTAQELDPASRSAQEMRDLFAYVRKQVRM